MDELTKIVRDTIVDYDIKSIDELKMQEKCTEIILSHPLKLYIPEYKKKYSFEESFYLSHQFMEYLSNDYADLLLKRLNDGAFVIDYRKEAVDKNAISTIIDGEPKIYIPYRNSLDCSFMITHEFIHDMTIKDGFNDTRTIFCEVFSIYAEMLQCEYFKDIKIKEAFIRDKKILDYVYLKSLNVSFDLELIKTYMTNGYIKNADIERIMKKYNYDINLFYYCYSIIENESLSFDLEQRYIYGYLIAAYLMERNYKGNSQEFLELNENLNKYSIDQFLNYLDLDINISNGILDLASQSYKKLEDSYIKILKKVRC